MSRREFFKTTSSAAAASFTSCLADPSSAVITASATTQVFLRQPVAASRALGQSRQLHYKSSLAWSVGRTRSPAFFSLIPRAGHGTTDVVVTAKARGGGLYLRQQQLLLLQQLFWYTTATKAGSEKTAGSKARRGSISQDDNIKEVGEGSEKATKSNTQAGSSRAKSDITKKTTTTKMVKKQHSSGDEKQQTKQKEEGQKTAGHKHERAASTDDVLKHPSTKRAKEVDGSDNPNEELRQLMSKQNDDDDNDGDVRNVLHWFRSKDLRAEDNRALHAAAEKAATDGTGKGKSCLLTCFLYSPQDLEWHGTSPARTDFMLEGLKLVQKQLEGELHVPLVFLTAEDRGLKTDKVLEFIKDNDVSHVYANIEYEVDELRRDIDMFKKLEGQGVRFTLLHDQTVVEPRKLTTAAGGPMKVFTPYHKAWLAKVSSDPELIDTLPAPRANDKAVKAGSKTKSLFGSKLPGIPKSKQYVSAEEKQRLRKLWPPGHVAGMKRLREFLENKVDTYSTHRSNPAADNASRMSAYFSSGTVSVREALSATRKIKFGDGEIKNGTTADFSESGPGGGGVAAWARELVFREFYRHMMVVLPHNSMNLPQNLKFDFVEWEDDEEGFQKWCEGKTGVPFVDAGMRQINHEAYMHNRLRMNTSSYLSRSLLIDYRRGERYFAEHLVDWDLCNNTQGWEPSYTVFNPVSQAERNDPKGDFIRRWVPELAGVEGKAVFDPYHRLSREEFEKLGYPKPHVDFAESKQRCIQRYKQDMADANP
ncbi:deoxyribodipyrimidine photo-lyase [Microdochium nivale]|nr:deoxyribodipyrimidine photo-lyase [Microdochium nivale]